MEFFRGTPIIVMEFFRVLVKLMWNSSGYYEVDVGFFRGMLIIVMIRNSSEIKGLRFFKVRVKCFEL